MARPRTEKSDYAKIQVRMPKTLLEAYRRSSAAIGRPLNTELVWALEKALQRDNEEMKDHHEPAYT
jgi:hypothetical protein